jgi:hypothetical protein
MSIASKFAITALSILAFSCGTDKSAETSASTSAAEKPSIAVATMPNADCTERMKSFLQWYLNFYDNQPDSTRFIQAMRYPGNPVLDGKPDTTRYALVDRKRLDSFMASLKKSGYFSTSYLQEKNKSIIERGKALQAARMNDGVFEGFAADEVFWMQEMYEPADISRISLFKSSQLKPSTFAIEVPTADQEGMDKFGFLLYLKNENGLCVIDSVAHLIAGKPESIKH